MAPALRNYPRPLFWPEHGFIAQPPHWGPPPPGWEPPPPHGRPNHNHPIWPEPEGPGDYEPGRPNRPSFRPDEAPRNRFDQASPEPTPVTQVTPERFGFTVTTTIAKAILKESSSTTENQFVSSNDGSSSPRPTRAETLQTASSVAVSESSSSTTIDDNTPPPITPDPLQVKIQLSVCINNCVTDKSIKSVCGSDNKTYQNRQFLDCAQKCGQSKYSYEYLGNETRFAII